MKKVRIYSAEEAASLVQNHDTISVSGFVSCGLPETLNIAIEKRFLETGYPKDLTLFYAAGLGNRDGSGADHFAHEGMTKRVIAGHWNLAPKLGQLAMENKIEAYNFPQGTLCQLYRDIAAHKLGTITHVGLNTFVDPRNQGGKLNDVTTEDMVELIEIGGKEQLFYKAFPINICFIRATYADEYGNITLEKEVAPFEVTSLAQATKNSGGRVIVQVESVVRGGTLDPKLVKIPGIYVDGIVVSKEEEHQQCLNHAYDPSLSGQIRVPTDSIEILKLDAKKIIGRRAAMELRKDTVVNLGIGVPEYVSSVANEEGIGDFMTLTVEVGPVGGIPQGGTRFGGSVNADCILDQPYQFDFYDGGGVDLAFLGLAQADCHGNVNVSKFGPRIAGCGGFINITQNAKKVFFCGTFTAGGLKTSVEDCKMTITKEGSQRKFVEAVEHITFSGQYANKTNQPVMYITERAVFELRKDGLYLTEVAPGIDIQTQIIDLMGFVPKIEGEVKLMDERIFSDEPMGLGNQ
ncbi:acyl CoA:acetate/3-ketoacid CoA transferase [Anaerotignum sp. MB30-C6]|uniref:acyl CoA:acetate/3-ketoacid CoA transferase n=1 Tax=Anaerotignum sp. MB30-C6 TaxID=3070814 RepID=UPI0027DBF3DE|nr:acyl CoA:acetate/3-ketoacid CoA transferase [Anaerotignum sp. MB30-C6]WMI80075.1 acyl CoA:acetate/3-ketoacid CoA transferase [Anaerotignum sp. MB30-C6]